MPSSEPELLYWDADVFLAAVNGEPGRIEHIRALLTDSDKGLVRIRTSTFSVTEVACPILRREAPVRKLYFGDNLDVLPKLKDVSVDLIYLDPPFNSKKDYNLIFKDEGGKRSTSQIKAFEDSWHWSEAAEEAYEFLTDTSKNKGTVPTEVSRLIGAMRAGIGTNDVLAYLVMMTTRLLHLHRVLKETGSIYLHCDPSASHYLKVVMDAIFGPRNFRREIIWRSGWVSGFKAAAPNWVRNHDVILYYLKDHDATFTFNKDTAYTPHADDYERRGGGENPKGVAMDDVWTDIYSPWIMSFSQEKLGWPTQKPIALLDRILEASSNKGDVVLDPFCGCGTALASAEHLGRSWIGIDITPLAIAVIRTRMSDHFGLKNIPVDGEPADLDGAQELATGDDGRYKFQWWAVGKVGARPVSDAEKKKGADEGIDGEMTFLDGDAGTDVERILISVKSGNTGAKDVRDLVGTVKRENAAVGVFVTLKPATGPMETEAVKAGWYESALYGKKYRKIQIVTAEDLLTNKMPNLPPQTKGYLAVGKKIDKKADAAPTLDL